MTAGLLDDAERMVVKYVAFPSEHHSVVVALWILHTWVVDAFYVTPRLILDSAEPGSGKTRVLELLALLCRSAKLTLSTTTAALYRRIAAAKDEGLQPPTVLQDEADAIFGKNSTPQAEDLRALFNAGYRKGATVDRCEGDAKNMKVREFPVHAPVALAGLAGRMPDTIRTRGITLHMRRRRPDQAVADFRERDALCEAAPIREQFEAWAAGHQDTLAAARPTMPAGVTDRAAEIWEPLLAIADLAGGDWPRKARAACTFFVVASAADDERLSLGQRLLRDIKMMFDAENTNAMWSSDIISKLTADPESEWRDLWGKALDQRRLAKELARYGVRSTNVRISVGQAKGYTTDGPSGLAQAWDHWLTPSASVPAVPSVTMQVKGVQFGTDDNSTVPAVPEPSPPTTALELGISQNGTAATAGTHAGDPEMSRAVDERSPCPDCQRAPARSDTGFCDFCTVRRRRQQTPDTRPSTPCSQWIRDQLDELRAAGHTTVEASVIYQAGFALGYSREALAQAASRNPDITIADRTGGIVTWSITPELPEEVS